MIVRQAYPFHAHQDARAAASNNTQNQCRPRRSKNLAVEELFPILPA
jgi:hypothetical protein